MSIHRARNGTSDSPTEAKSVPIAAPGASSWAAKRRHLRRVANPCLADPPQSSRDIPRRNAPCQQTVPTQATAAATPLRRDPRDARQLNVALTANGKAYAQAIDSVIDQLNHALTRRVTRSQLAAADIVLRAVLTDEHTRTLSATAIR